MCCVAHDEGHEKELKEAKESCYGDPIDVGGIHRYLVVCSDFTELIENTRTRELVGVIMYVSIGVTVGNCSGVLRSIVSTGMPKVSFLGTM
jgi:hypothetical protein